MAKKDIRLTFYYADESIWDLVKKNKTKKRLVTWAESFFARYGFKIDEFPTTYSERTYKRKFCLKKTNGTRADYASQQQLKDEYRKLDKLFSDYKLKFLDMALNDTLPADEKQRQLDAIKAEWDKVTDEMRRTNEKIGTSSAFEIEFRKQIYPIHQSLSLTKERLAVIFCEFENAIDPSTGRRTVGETFDLRIGGANAIFAWAIVSFKWPDAYGGTIVIIDVNRMTKKAEYTLAHEIVHAAGNTTADNQGTAKNIMIYKDAEGKAPSDVNLESTDKTKLETAYFVK